MGKWFLGLLNVILFFAVGWHTVLGYGFSIKGGRVWGSNFSSHLSSFFPSTLLISNILSPDLPIALTADCWSSRPAVTRGWFWVVTIVTLAASSPTPTPPLNHGKRPCVELFCWLFVDFGVDFRHSVQVSDPMIAIFLAQRHSFRWLG